MGRLLGTDRCGHHAFRDEDSGCAFDGRADAAIDVAGDDADDRCRGGAGRSGRSPFARNRCRDQGAADAGGGIYSFIIACRVDYGGGPCARCGVRLCPHPKAEDDRRDGRDRIARRARTQVAGKYRRAERDHRHDDQDADGSEFRWIGRRIYLAESPRRIETRTPAQGVRSADGSDRKETRNGEEGGRGAGRTGQGNGRGSQANRGVDEVHRRNQRADGAEHGHHR